MPRRPFAILSVLVLAGCAWGQPGYDGGNASDNRTETTISPQTVNGLHELWKTAGGNATAPVPIVSGGYLLTSTNAALVATATAGCPGGGVPTCAAAWHVDGSFGPPVSDGVSVFVRDLATERLGVFDLHGNPLWTFTPAPVPNRTSTLSSEIHIDAGRVWLEVRDADTANATTVRLVSLPAAGCGASSCNAVTTIAPDPDNSSASDARFAAAEEMVFRNRRDAGTPYLQAFDATTGIEQWRSSTPTAGNVSVRDGWVVTSKPSGGHDFPLVVFPTRAGNGCTGVPKRCAPFATFAGAGNPWLAITNHHFLTINSDGDVSAVAKDLTTSCTATHACSHVWFGRFGIPSPGTGPMIAAGGLVYAAKKSVLADDALIAAFSDDGATGCTTTTVTRCTSLWSTTLAAVPRGLAVAGGRLYVAEADGLVHVYGL